MSYSSKKVAFDLLLANLPGILKAQLDGFGNFAPPDNFNAFARIHDFPGLKFSTPQGYFEFQGLTDEQKQMLIMSGLEAETSKTGCYVGCPNFEHMKRVYELNPASNRVPPDYVTPDGIYAYVLLLKGMAFYSSASHALGYPEIPIMVQTKNESLAKQGTIQVEFGASADKTTLTLGVEDYAIFSKTPLFPIAVPIDASRSFVRGISNSVSPKIKKVHEGGRFFPYFKNMVLPDRLFAFKVFSDIFFSSLSDDPALTPAVLNVVRKGISNLAKTEAGMALSHAYMGIHLSKQSHSYITFIINQGVYQGFVLESGFTVVLTSTQYKPIAWTEVENDIKNANKHDHTIQKICILFESAKSSAGTILLSTTAADINTSRKFIRHFQNIQLNAYKDTFMAELRKLVGDLTYNEKFEPLSVGTLKIFLQYVTTEDESLLDNLPAWLDGYFEKCSNPVAMGLGIFGNVALSVNYGGDKDQKFQMPSDIGAVDPNLALKADGKRVLPYLPVKKVEINKALGHWNRLFETGIFQIPPGRKGKQEFTDQRPVHFEIGGVPQFPEIYGLIKTKVMSQKNKLRMKRKQVEGAATSSGGSSKKGKGRDTGAYGAL